jgi:hypothetical protein
MVVSLVHPQPQLSHYYGHDGCWFTLALVMKHCTCFGTDWVQRVKPEAMVFYQDKGGLREAKLSMSPIYYSSKFEGKFNKYKDCTCDFFFIKFFCSKEKKNKQTHAFQLQGEFSEMLVGPFHVQKCPHGFFMFCNKLSLNNTH